MTDAADIKKLRDAFGWTQEQLADYLGVDRSVVSRMENGQAPSGPVVRLLEILETGQLPPLPPRETAAGSEAA